MAKSTKYFDLFSALKSGGDKGVSPEALQKTLGFTPGALAVYIHALRNKFGAKIESVRNGRSVVAYRLTNIAECETRISPTRKTRTVKATKTAKKSKVVKAVTKRAKVTKTTKVAKEDDGSIPVLDADLDVTEYSDRELADISEQLGIV